MRRRFFSKNNGTNFKVFQTLTLTYLFSEFGKGFERILRNHAWPCRGQQSMSAHIVQGLVPAHTWAMDDSIPG